MSTTTTIAILTAAELAWSLPAAIPRRLIGATATLSLLVGAMLLVASLLRLGFVANFISEPVLVGFKAGIGLVIVLDQVPKLLGIHFAKGGFFHNLLAIVQAVPDTSVPTLIVGVATIVLLVASGARSPASAGAARRVAVGIAAMSLLGLEARGVEPVGTHSAGPSVAHHSRTSRSLAELWPGACGIALMSFTETIAAGARLRADRRASAPAEPGAARDGTRQRRRCSLRRDALGWRHVADRREPARRRRAHSSRRS